jgi:hypothetical protein
MIHQRREAGARETCRDQIKGSDKDEVRHLATRVSVNVVNTGGLLGVGSRVARVGTGEIGNRLEIFHVI